jgi:hypothetical protein
MASTVPLRSKLLYTYFASNALYGFYRGFNNLHSKDSIMKRESDLYIDKVAHGLCTSVVYSNPGIYPFSIYYGARRTEKVMRGIQLDDEDWRF